MTHAKPSLARLCGLCRLHPDHHACARWCWRQFWLNRIAKFLVYGILGIAVALCWGYAGILNLGQGLFFGAGAYMIACR